MQNHEKNIYEQALGHIHGHIKEGASRKDLFRSFGTRDMETQDVSSQNL
jgi:hypothetical protein